MDLLEDKSESVRFLVVKWVAGGVCRNDWCTISKYIALQLTRFESRHEKICLYHIRTTKTQSDQRLVLFAA